MTLALALRCADGLVLATDSRLSAPGRQVDFSEKFLQVNRDIGIMTYGLAIPGSRGMRAVLEKVREDSPQYASMDRIRDDAQALFVGEHDKFIVDEKAKQAAKKAVNPAEMDPDEYERQLRLEQLGFIIAGYDGNDTGLFRILYATADQGFAMSEQTDIVAAQWPLSQLLLPFLRYSGMSTSIGARLATLLMILTATHEPTVGGQIHLATVNFAEGFNLLHEREVASLIEQAQLPLVGIREAFLDSWTMPFESSRVHQTAGE